MPRWTIDVDDQTDRAVRAHLARTGEGKADLSSFVADAARRAALRQTVEDFRSAFAELTPDQIQALANEAVDRTRADSA